MDKRSDTQAFEQSMLPYLDAAYGLARWLVRNDVDAEDIVQEAFLRAWKGYAAFHGKNEKAWILTIVRNTCFTWLKTRRGEQHQTSFDEEIHTDEQAVDNPHTLFSRNRDRLEIRRAVAALPLEFREAIVMREWEGFSYKEISEITDVPIGTVMSRLTRARERLQKTLSRPPQGK